MTELVDVRHLDLVAEVADVIQIGARNMQNYTLLTEVGRAGVPVLLKRGPSATLEELLLAAEYVTCEGNDDVILCERGIRTFEDAYRFTLDLVAVPVLKERTHLPVIVDPSHAAGPARAGRAAVAGGGRRGRRRRDGGDPPEPRRGALRRARSRCTRRTSPGSRERVRAAAAGSPQAA